MRHSTILAAAAPLLLGACSIMSGKETTGQYVDDTTLEARAKAALVKDSTVSATDFTIAVYKGDVTLSGVAKTPDEVQRAIEDIRTVPGIKSVKNATRVATSDRGDGKSQ